MGRRKENSKHRRTSLYNEMKKKEKQLSELSNFLQVGRMFECSKCHPEKGYADYHKEYPCKCICHDKKETKEEQCKENCACKKLGKTHYHNDGCGCLMHNYEQCKIHSCDIRKCDECFQGNEKESKKGESWRKGYQQGVKEERERLVENLENYDLSNCTNDYQFGFSQAKKLLTNRW